MLRLRPARAGASSEGGRVGEACRRHTASVWWCRRREGAPGNQRCRMPTSSPLAPSFHAEIAVHTVNHLQMYPGFKAGDGSIEKEIMDDKNWLNSECGIPNE